MRQERRAESKQLRAKHAELVALIDRLDLEILQATGLQKIQLEDRKEKAEREKTQVETRLDELESRPDRERTPYVGLNTFRESDADLFYGRDKLVAELVEKVGQWPFLAVLGPSGSGKSSVVRAGLIPELKEGALLGSGDWLYATLKPGSRPLDALAVALSKLQEGKLGGALELRRSLEQDERALLLSAELLTAEREECRLLLMVDQFEELWTLTPVEEAARQKFTVEQREPFIHLLLMAAEATDTPVTVIITMRADFLHRAAEYPDLARQIQEHLLIVSPMTAEELESAITDPALEAGGGFEPGLVQELVGEVEGVAGALPLLEYTLLELWKRRNDDDVMSWEAYQDLGGVEGALAVTADDILEHKYEPEQRDELRLALLKLIQPGEGAADTRRRTPLDDLVPVGGSVDDIQAMLKPLADERLITTGRDEASGEEIVEISHEALIRAWPTLAEWIDDGREDMRYQLQVEEEAKRWQDFDENPDYLLRGLSLANADDWLARAQPQLTELENRFLHASREAEQARIEAEETDRRERGSLLEAKAEEERKRADAEKRNASRLRIFLIGAFVLAAIALMAGGLAILNANRANEQAAIAEANAEREIEAQAEAEQAKLEAEVATEREAEQKKTAQANAEKEAVARVEAERERQRADEQAAIAEANAKKEAEARIAAETAANLETVARVRAESETRRAQALAHAGEALFELSRQNPDDALLLALASTRSVAQPYPTIIARALRRAVEETLPSKPLPTHGNWVIAAGFSADGQRAYSASRNGEAHIWDSEARVVSAATDVGDVSAAAWEVNSGFLAVGDQQGQLMIWDVSSAEPTRVIDAHDGAINALVWNASGDQLATADNNIIRLWDVATGRNLADLVGQHSVAAIDWDRDGGRVLTGSWDGTARLWDTQTGVELSRLAVGSAVWTVALSADGLRALTGGGEDVAQIWDVVAETPIFVLPDHAGQVSDAAWQPDGSWVVTGSSDGDVRMWDADNGVLIMTIDACASPVRTIAWSLDGTEIIVGCSSGKVKQWFVAFGAGVSVLSGHKLGIWSATWSPDGEHILTGGEDATLRLWNPTDGAAEHVLKEHRYRVIKVGWSPDGSLMASGGDDQVLLLWDAALNAVVERLQGHSARIYDFAWNPVGDQILSVSADTTARLWDVGSGAELALLAEHASEIKGVAWSPDGSRVFTGDVNGMGKLWDVTVEPPTLQASLVQPGEIADAAWSPDGRWILTGSSDNSVRVWDAINGELKTVLKGHTNRVETVAWSPDSRQVVSGSRDHSALVWDVVAGQSISVLEGHTDWVTSVAWSPDGNYLLTGSSDGMARTWVAESDLLLAEATERVCNLFDDEMISELIEQWRGCEVELEAVAEDLAEYKRLMGKD